jgi:hypothetical protein
LRKIQILARFGFSLDTFFAFYNLFKRFSRCPQINTAQINPRQLVSPLKLNPTEIPLTSSISLQQFLGSHNYSLQNTTVPTWLSYLGGTTPFNLNIAVTDLPTGQLAEAQLTGFAADGTPNVGTLLLDYNGNDLGWFIDPTPWENSEFDQTLAATAYRANTNSAAAGRDDLLTTILQVRIAIMSAKNGTFNGSSTLMGSIDAKGDTTFNGKATVVGVWFRARVEQRLDDNVSAALYSPSHRSNSSIPCQSSQATPRASNRSRGSC